MDKQHNIDKNNIVNNANSVAVIVLSQAKQASDQGTFAVGGCIVENKTGRLIHSMHNNVVNRLNNTDSAFTYDPTAHGERQLVYWYYANKDRLALPETKELTIVTSLDPCVMCTGTLLTAGFNVAVLAMDGYAGINYDKKFSFESLPINLRDLAKSTFGYYASKDRDNDPSINVRSYIGGDVVAFKNTAVDSKVLDECNNIFHKTLDKVCDSSSNSGLEPSKLINPEELPDDSPIKIKFREVYPEAFNMNIPNTQLSHSKLHSLLADVKNSSSNAKNSVAFLDYFGNVVLCFPDTFDVSPVHTAFMNVTQQYAKVRYALMDDKNTYREATNYLTHPKYGTFVFLYAPNPNDSTTIMTLGAYGSTMEGSIPQSSSVNLQYFYPPLKGTIEELNSTINNLPPFYTELVQISMSQIESN